MAVNDDEMSSADVDEDEGALDLFRDLDDNLVALEPNFDFSLNLSSFSFFLPYKQESKTKIPCIQSNPTLSSCITRN
mgnify:CR=1 FL=1